MTGGPPPTDFARFDHDQLIRMLAETDPNGVARAGDAWADIARSLHERADDLADQLARFGDSWQGEAATRHRAMVTDLADGMRRLADGALALRDLVHGTADALRTAWLQMPAVADGAAHREAVRVMSTLAAHYRRTAAAMPEVPRGLVSTGDGDGTGQGPAAGTGVFGRLVPAGLAAAAAALGGRFGPQPRGRLANPAVVAATVATATSKAGGAGGGSAGGRAFRGVALPALPTPPAGEPVPTAPQADRIAVGGGAGASAGGRAAGGVPPMMPMGMMGGAEQGSGTGRRLPPWLVDTEDIWGESTVVVPGVLGE